MILGILGEKGGTGKSTVATNLAAYLAGQGKDVLILDADPQGTAYKWNQRRDKEAPRISCVQAFGDIYDAVMDQARRFGHVIIDAGGHDSEALRAALLAADVAYAPLQASQPDIETSGPLNRLIGDAKKLNRKLIARAVISRAPTNPMINETMEAREALAELDQLDLSRVFVRDRKIYRDAMVEGLGVVEMTNSKAKAEIQLLGQEIFA
ncbi:MAG: AAA family ATPase [Candidatus Sedimenticola sp. (ex Thyasira tokunagai)]